MSTYITSWFSPTSLFLLLNLVVGIIFIISRFGAGRRPQHDHFSSGHPPPLARTPSLLDRVKSINFSGNTFEPSMHEQASRFERKPDPDPDPNPLARAPSLLERVKSIKFPSFHRSEPICQDPQTDRTTQEPKSTPETDIIDNNRIPASEESKLAALLDDEKKEDRERQRRRPAMREIEKTVPFEEKGVDAKADDFISRFKNQLRVQRLESILRHKEMSKRN